MKDLTMLILSCDKFSDLWDGHVKLLEQNWPDRDLETYIVTDAPGEKSYPNIQILSAGAEVEWSDRLKYALTYVKTDYVFITLDDYFLIRKVSDSGIRDLIRTMETEGYRYTRLYKHPKRATGKELPGHKKVYEIDPSVKYSVNLYAGIWKKELLETMVRDSQNAWQFEVSLAKKVQDCGAGCLVSYREDFEILDVVRKGKLLHKAAKYFKKHPGIYEGNRETQSRSYEAKLWVQTMVARMLPLRAHKYVKALMRKCGKSFFSDGAE